MMSRKLASAALALAYVLAAFGSAVCAAGMPAAAAPAVAGSEHACCRGMKAPAAPERRDSAPCCSLHDGQAPALLPAAVHAPGSPDFVLLAAAPVAPVRAPALVLGVFSGRPPPGGQVRSPSSLGSRAPPSPAAVL